MRKVKLFVVDQIELQRGHLFVWSPVLFGIGIGVYFALRFEPSGAAWRAVACGLCLLGISAIATRDWARIACVACLLVLGGFAIAGFKAHRMAEVTLDFRFYGAIQGRIIRVDRS
ncbi:MAG: competence protein, partial [Pseudomonadota bacterium]